MEVILNTIILESGDDDEGFSRLMSQMKQDWYPPINERADKNKITERRYADSR